MFIDEKKFNLSGLDGLKYYWHDLRRTQSKVEWDPNTRNGVMVWKAIRYKDAIDSDGAVGSMDAQYQTTILEEGLLPAVYDAMVDTWN